MVWNVIFHSDFDAEYKTWDSELQDELLAHLKLLAQTGPNLGRPYVDTLKDSKHANMKELRFNWQDAVWRVAFAFDPNRKAVVLFGGNRGGKNQKLFCKDLISMADNRFDKHLAQVKARHARAKELAKQQGKAARRPATKR